ncbi:MAG: zf-HC2 domain-containing protein [Frankiales bacterium]|nr:MAG: zf-HC2 domain-containing protein [Frankiales bacterium]
MTRPGAPEHRQLRELLGAFALDGLPDDARTTMRAHLDGCATCRGELADIAPLAEDLRTVSPDALTDLAAPPPDLGERIRTRIAQERELAQARQRRDVRRAQARRGGRQLVAAAAAAAVVAAALGAGTLLGRSTAPATTALPAPSPSAVIPIELVAVRSMIDDVQTEEAAIIAHTWGVEARFEGTGFEQGRVYKAAFRSTDGRLLPAGEFLGTGGKVLKCNMQSALLRSDTIGFVVTDDSGTTVLAADL